MTDLSVLVTVYNCKDYIDECVESVLSQTGLNFELVIFDDGCTDTTITDLRISDTRVRIVGGQRVGRGKALNLGIEECVSPFISILDADDVCLPGRLASSLEFLKENPEVAIVGSRFRTYMDSRGHLTGKESVAPTDFPDILDALAGFEQPSFNNPLFHSSITIRRSALSSVGGYDETLACLLDLDLYVRIASAFEIRNIHRRLSLKRLHDDQYFWGPSGVATSPDGEKARAIVTERLKKLVSSGGRL